MGDYLVSTERLGWPRRRWWDRPWALPLRVLFPWEIQSQRVHEDSPEVPTATCHLQPSGEEPALCGYPWEGLIGPGDGQWTDLHPEMRCEDCAAASGLATEDPTGRTYRYRLSEPPDA